MGTDYLSTNEANSRHISLGNSLFSYPGATNWGLSPVKLLMRNHLVMLRVYWLLPTIAIFSSSMMERNWKETGTDLFNKRPGRLFVSNVID